MPPFGVAFFLSKISEKNRKKIEKNSKIWLKYLTIPRYRGTMYIEKGTKGGLEDDDYSKVSR